MNQENKKLADFVIEQYNKVKKAKKAPKNFFVYEQDGDITSSTYYLRKDNGLSFCLGNLFDLYINAVNLQEAIKNPLFTTKDGVQIYDGDSWWFIDKYNPEEPKEERLVITSINDLDEDFLYFSSKQAALNYIHNQQIKNKSTDTNMYSVVLSDCCNSKLACIKAVKDATGLGLKESKELVKNIPNVVLRTTDRQIAVDSLNAFVGLKVQAHMTTPAIEVSSDPYKGFDLTWIPILKHIFGVLPMDWRELDENEQAIWKNKDNFQSFINWSKQ